MNYVIQKDRNGEHEPEQYVTRNDGALVSTANLDAEDLRFLAAEARDRETAAKLRALARKREPEPPLQPGRYLVADRRTGEPIEVELLGPPRSRWANTGCATKGMGGPTCALCPPKP
jgi:hypothetical protein